MALVETRSIDYVPLAERHGKAWHLWPIWFMGDAHLATLATGAIGILQGLDFFWTALAVLGGGLLGTFFMAFHSTQGPELGLPQMIQSRPQFGYIGALLVWVVALITYVGFNAFNQAMIANTAAELAHWPGPPVMVAFAVLAVLIAMAGYDVIHRAQRVLALVMLVMLAAYTLGALRIADLSALLTPHRFVAGPFLVQFFAAATYQLSWSIYVSDYSRYLPRGVGVRESFWWTFGGAFVGGAWMMLIGTFAAAMLGAGDIVGALRHTGDAMYPGFGMVMLVTSVLGLVTITALNFYGASLTLIAIVDSLGRVTLGRRARVVSLLVVLLVVLALSLSSGKNLVAQFEELLAILLYLFTPWTAINLVDFFFVRRGRYSIRAMFDPDGLYGRWNWRGLVAYALGFLAMAPCFKTGLYTGPVARALGGADISMLVGLPVAGLFYYWVARRADLASEFALIPQLDANLETEGVR
ncbi:MAG: cytosine permease [Proteobacteria bacterium]|nr:cytosine permease [Pseudomonadota bacterium]